MTPPTSAEPQPGQRFSRLFTSPWLLAAVVLLSFFWQLGASPLYDLDEGAFTEATREMLASGNYITPHKDGEPRYDKPILIYWLQAASTQLLGFNEFALRLPSAVAATLWVMAVWGFVRARLDADTAVVAGLVMALSLQVSLIGKAAVADALLNLFIALTFFEIYRYFLESEPTRARRLVRRAFLWMALGFLTKGPVAMLFPVLVSLLFFWSQGAWQRWLRAAFAPSGWLLWLAITLPWYLAVYLDDGAGFFRSFFLEHNVGRFGEAMHGHAGFPGYYVVMLPLILLPFTGWFLRLLPDLRAAWSDPLERFLWIWFLSVFVFFSFSGTKLPHYLLYGATPLFILMAKHRQRLTQTWLAFAPPLLFLALLLTLPLLVDLAESSARKAHELAMFQDAQSQLGAGYLVTVFIGLAATLALALWSRPALWQRLVLAGVLQTLIVYGVLVPRVLEVMQAPVKEAGLLAKRLDLPTVVYRTSMPSFSVYRDAITPQRAPVPGELVFVRVDKLKDLAAAFPELQQDVVYRRGPVALVMTSDEQRPDP
ncbi:glycoside hydrolase [Thiocapsa imhoffii]|uniref:Glycoside hydrolase n=1 Tax=Thiocapsa imhoffii TaxID=382777 RepID=A0A9X0WFF1_9GAMM|nr:glycosyltransferase family 39 protein [Thiocapsa imhoffii]MBK1643573.1 glycoside hydrolase [Thiocapsa imhoffii]